MWGKDFDDSRQDYQNGHDENKPSLGYEAVGAGAGFGAVKLFEDYQRKEGNPTPHAKAYEFLGAMAGLEVDRLAQTKGADWMDNREDRERAKEDAGKHARDLYDSHYRGENDSDNDQYDPNRREAPRAIRDHFGDDFQNSNYGDYHGDNYRNYGN